MGWGQISTLKNDPTCNFAPRVVTIYKLHWDVMGSNFNVEKWPQTSLGWGRGQILTLKKWPFTNLPSRCSNEILTSLEWDGVKMTLHVILLYVKLQYINFIGMGWVQILTLKNDPTWLSAPPVFIKYKIHWDGVGSFNVEKWPYM